jgi:hypothetical protein
MRRRRRRRHDQRSDPRRCRLIRHRRQVSKTLAINLDKKTSLLPKCRSTAPARCSARRPLRNSSALLPFRTKVLNWNANRQAVGGQTEVPICGRLVPHMRAETVERRTSSRSIRHRTEHLQLGLEDASSDSP